MVCIFISVYGTEPSRNNQQASGEKKKTKILSGEAIFTPFIFTDTRVYDSHLLCKMTALEYIKRARFLFYNLVGLVYGHLQKRTSCDEVEGAFEPFDAKHIYVRFETSFRRVHFD